MNHEAYLGKLTEDETHDLFSEMLVYLDFTRMAEICKTQLDDTDYAELVAEMMAKAEVSK